MSDTKLTSETVLFSRAYHSPWKLIIWPSLRAAPRILDNLETSLSIFPALSISDAPVAAPPVTRLKLSPTAPNAMLVPSPAYCQILPKRDEGTRDSLSW